MKKVLFGILLLGATISPGFAQRISRVMSGVDVGTGFANDQWGPSLLFYQALSLPKVPWIQLSGGLRVWSYFANDINLKAPSGSLQSDIMQLSRVTATGANFMLGINLRVADRLDIGGNADLLGLAIGKRRNAIYKLGSVAAASDSIRKLNNTEFGVAPANLNLLPVFIRQNNGQAEVFARLWVTPRFGIKAGYVLGQVAYRADNKLNNGQRRFSSTYQMPFIALSFPLYN